MRRSRAFTLVELLVVIGIIAILASILIPVVSKARDHGNELICQNNLRQLVGAFVAFSSDHDGQLPGSDQTDGTMSASGDLNPDHRDWLMVLNPIDSQRNYQMAPDGGPNPTKTGSVWKYVNNKRIYLCPTYGYGDGIPESAAQSNGHFDYSAFGCFAGAPLRSISTRAKLWTGSTTNNPVTTPADFTDYATPLIVQEDPTHINNKPSVHALEGDHGKTDPIGHMHHGGSFCGAIDGSVFWVNEPKPLSPMNTGVTTDGCWRWWSMGQSTKTWQQMSDDSMIYGNWASK